MWRNNFPKSTWMTPSIAKEAERFLYPSVTQMVGRDPPLTPVWFPGRGCDSVSCLLSQQIPPPLWNSWGIREVFCTPYSRRRWGHKWRAFMPVDPTFSRQKLTPKKRQNTSGIATGLSLLPFPSLCLLCPHKSPAFFWELKNPSVVANSWLHHPIPSQYFLCRSK